MLIPKVFLLISFSLFSIFFNMSYSRASGVVPEASVVIIEEEEGQAAINIRNTDDFPVLLLSTLEDIKEDKAPLLTITPPAARIEANGTQSVRFILTHSEKLETERLKRVIFEGVPPQKKGKNEVRIMMRQNLPVIIRPAGLEKNRTPWEKLGWKMSDSTLVVSNNSPYVVRLGLSVNTLPDQTDWLLPRSYVLPGETVTLKRNGPQKSGTPEKVRIHPATTWGFSTQTYDAALSK